MSSSSVVHRRVNDPEAGEIPSKPEIASPQDSINGSNETTTPLLSKENRPPLVKLESEFDLDDDDREVVNSPHPGVDPGFFEGNDKDPEVETITPDIINRAGGGEMSPDDVDGKQPAPGYPGSLPPSYPDKPRFPYAPGFGGFDIETGTMPDLDNIPDVNVYQHKKTLAQGMMDLALFSANANQLRYVLESFSRHPYYYPSLILISISLILQIAVGIGLIWNATYNVKDKKEICIANKINNFTIIGIFLVTVINVFISAFGVANPYET